jgi:hypothetical protein
MSEPLVPGGVEYRWREFRLSEIPSPGWAHHDVAALGDGSLIAAHPEGRRLVRIRPGDAEQQIETELTEIHGITVVGNGGQERLWVSDNGHKFVPDRPDYAHHVTFGRAVEVDLAGKIWRELRRPEIPAYEAADWMPCGIAVDEGVPGASGRIWVADGYSQSLLHCFDSAGTYLSTVDGSESGTPFSTPHAVVLRRREGVPELYVADRGNARIVVLDIDGRYLRSVGQGVLTSPSGFALQGSDLLVTELFGSVVVLNGSDEFVARLGDCGSHDRPGWPNARVDGEVAPADPPAGCFNSPHGITVGSGGRIYVSEWMIGGRLVELTPAGG